MHSETPNSTLVKMNHQKMVFIATYGQMYPCFRESFKEEFRRQKIALDAIPAYWRRQMKEAGIAYHTDKVAIDIEQMGSAVISVLASLVGTKVEYRDGPYSLVDLVNGFVMVTNTVSCAVDARMCELLEWIV